MTQLYSPKLKMALTKHNIFVFIS